MAPHSHPPRRDVGQRVGARHTRDGVAAAQHDNVTAANATVTTTTAVTTTVAAADATATTVGAMVEADVDGEPPIRRRRRDNDDDSEGDDAVGAAPAKSAAGAVTTTARTMSRRPPSGGGAGDVLDDAVLALAVASTTPGKPAYPASTASSSSSSSSSSSRAVLYGKAAAAAVQRSRVWRSSARLLERAIPYGGLVSNCFSLSSVTLGGGIISMPSSFATSGIVMAVVYLVLIAALTVYTMLVMGYVMQRTHARTFEETATLLAGRRWGYFVGGVLWISCIGAAVAYVSAVSGLLYPIVQHSPHAPAYLKTDNGNRVLTSLVWLCCMLPFVLPKRVNSIRYLSAVGCTMVVYFVCVVVAHSCTNGLPRGMRGDMRYFTTGNKAIYGLSIFMFAYLCQAMSQPVYFEMRPRPSIRQLTLASAIAVGACTVLYILAGVFGYMDFGDETRDSVLYNFDPVHQPYVMVAYVGMLVKLCAAYAVNMIPCRNVVYHCLRWDLDTLSYWRHAAVVVGMSIAVLLLGLFTPSVNTAFGLVGSLCGGFTGFIFPALLYMYSGNWSLKTVGWGNYMGTYVLLVSGVIAICFGTVATIYSSFIDTP